MHFVAARARGSHLVGMDGQGGLKKKERKNQRHKNGREQQSVAGARLCQGMRWATGRGWWEKKTEREQKTSVSRDEDLRSDGLTTSMRLSWMRFRVVLSLLLMRPRPDDSYCRRHTHTHTRRGRWTHSKHEQSVSSAAPHLKRRAKGTQGASSALLTRRGES